MRTSDNLDGTFSNPLIFADYPDPDIIRVDEDFYLVSSSFTDTPGIPVCHSRDLVNWRIIGHVYDRLPEQNSAYSMAGGETAYRGGSWAPSIRHHQGIYYVGFCTPSEGFCLARAPRPEGPYELHWFGVELYDPGLFFDDDGRVFVVHGANDIYLTELVEDCRKIGDPARLLYSTAYGNPLEGSHVYKTRGWYFICNTSRAYNGIQIVYRSRDLLGTYESRLLTADDMNYSGAGLHQGGFVELSDGTTWFFLFQDRDYVGRVPVLMPVRWRDGWPEVGDPANFGKVGVTYHLPVSLTSPEAPEVPEGSDDFDSKRLGLQWRWNHNPDDTRWSLSERPGWLRLYAGPADGLLNARNTLAQKIMGGGCMATTLLDSEACRPGDFAGIGVLGFPHAFIAVETDQDTRRIVMSNDGQKIAETCAIEKTRIWLRAEADAAGLARFCWSTDGSVFHPLGDDLVMQFSVKSFLGNKFGLFCYQSNAGACGGHADFDYLQYQCRQGSANHHVAGARIPAVSYDREFGTDTQRVAEKRPAQWLCNLHNGDWIAFNHVDCGAGVSRFTARASPIGDGGAIEIRCGGPEGDLLATCRIPGIGEMRPWLCPWEDFEVALPLLRGVMKICLRFVGGEGQLMRMDHFRLG